MTKNQIDYNKLVETRRSNLENEEIARTRAEREYELGILNLQELGRHNMATEAHAVNVLAESSRAAREQERLLADRNLETQRANLRAEEISLSNLAEQSRSNRAREAETYRSNLAKEVELHRSNLESESIRRRANVINAQSVSLGYSQLAEAQRANVQREKENVRSAKASEQIRRQQIAATKAVQQEANRETKRANKAREKESKRHNQAVEQETTRHNVSDEGTKMVGAYSGAINQFARSAAMVVAMN